MLNIIWEDPDVIVCVKPSGVLSEGESADSMPVLLAKQINAGAPVFVVHRLDRGTEGLMVYAKNQRSAAALGAAMAGHGVHKEYLVHIHGVPTGSCGRMEDLLYFDRRKNKSYVVKRMRKGVKEAALSYRLIRECADGTSWVRVFLETGRTHQIRIQFASRRMPLVGDRRYGSSASEAEFCLRAVALTFPHPVTGEMMRFHWGED